MAEVAAGVLVAEQVISTTAEVGVAYTIARPPQLFEAKLFQVNIAPSDEADETLARSHHTVTIIGNKAFLFGGEKSNRELCDTDMHEISMPSEAGPGGKYSCYPTVSLREAGTGEVFIPSPRARHAALARGRYVIIYGGSDARGDPIDEDACLWSWDSESLAWNKIYSATMTTKPPAPRFNHNIFIGGSHQDFAIMHGGQLEAGSNKEQCKETWLFEFDSGEWTELTTSPVAPSCAAYSNDTLYTVSSDSDIGGSVQYLKIGMYKDELHHAHKLPWHKVDFPSTPLTPGPRARTGSALIPVTTGYGRQYLLYMFGSREDTEVPAPGQESTKEPAFYSDIWSLQLPSRGGRLSLSGIKDMIRERLPGVDSGVFSWAEVDIAPVEQKLAEGKVHPGPRAFSAASSCFDETGVIFWGGINPKQENESDGWVLKVD